MQICIRFYKWENQSSNKKDTGHDKAGPKKEVFDLWTWNWLRSLTILVPKEGLIQQNKTSVLAMQICIKFYK